jgi:hypothetical protein
VRRSENSSPAAHCRPSRRQNMEHLWSRADATDGNRQQTQFPRRPLTYLLLSAHTCHHLPRMLHGKEGVDPLFDGRRFLPTDDPLAARRLLVACQPKCFSEHLRALWASRAESGVCSRFRLRRESRRGDSNPGPHHYESRPPSVESACRWHGLAVGEAAARRLLVARTDVCPINQRCPATDCCERSPPHRSSRLALRRRRERRQTAWASSAPANWVT